MSNRLRYTRLHEDVFTADTPQKMRAAIEKSAYEHPLIRRALDAARFEGFTGEDTMVFLATYLLRENDRLHGSVLNGVSTNLSPFFVPA